MRPPRGLKQLGHHSLTSSEGQRVEVLLPESRSRGHSRRAGTMVNLETGNAAQGGEERGETPPSSLLPALQSLACASHWQNPAGSWLPSGSWEMQPAEQEKGNAVILAQTDPGLAQAEMKMQ